LDGQVSITFSDPHAPYAQAVVYAVRAVDRYGASSAEPSVVIYLYSTEFYASQGLTARGVLIFTGGDLRTVATTPGEWIVDTPSLEDVAFAQSEWGAAVPLATEPFTRARRLAGAILDRIAFVQGIPSSGMDLPPFEQYQRAALGQDFVDSTILSSIFSHACNALGIPARIVEMGTVLSRGSQYDLLETEPRAAVEVFDEATNRWVYFDLAAAMLGVELQGYGTLNAAELLRAVNDPVLIADLTAHTYDAAVHVEALDAFTSIPAVDSVRKYFGSHPMLRFSRRAE
jgi:hypothetical protein